MIENIKNIPKVAIIGKPNSGKSTLVNRVIKRFDAIVHSEPKITRDRKYYEAEWDGILFYLMDTGGIDSSSDDRLSLQIMVQTTKALDEADIVVFMVDASEPITVLDQEIAGILRKKSKKVIVAANKCDNISDEYYLSDYIGMGLGTPIKISSIHGLGINDLLDEVVENIKEVKKDSFDMEQELEDAPRISILGKPNVGKSTLFNTIIEEERVIVDEIEGTTRDTIDSLIIKNSKKYIIIDTAGLKKRRPREEDLEYYSKIRTLKAIEASDVGIILLDALKGVTKQDIKIVEMCIKRGTSICMVFNKIDITDNQILQNNIDILNRELVFAPYIPFLKISAAKGEGVLALFEMIEHILEERKTKISENSLNKFFKGLLSEKEIYSKKKKYKLKFIRQIKSDPPGFLVFSNMNISKKKNIQRFIENSMRDKFGFVGTPITFKFKY